MKNIFFLANLILICTLLLLNSCSIIDDSKNKVVPQQVIDFSMLIKNAKVVNGRREKALKATIDEKFGWLVFETEQDFADAVDLIVNNNQDVVRTWAMSNSFNSLFKLYEQVIKEQKMFINALAQTKQLNGFPICDLLKKHQEKFSITNEGIDMKVTLDAMAFLLNENNCVKINNSIRQYNHDNIKTIISGNVEKLNSLASIKTTQGDVHVSEVKRTSQKINSQIGGRTEDANPSCDSRDDWDIIQEQRLYFAVLGYIESVTYFSYTIGYGGQYIHRDYIKMRSLSRIKFLGTNNWLNSDSYTLRSEGNIKLQWYNYLQNTYTVLETDYISAPLTQPTHTNYYYFTSVNLLTGNAAPVWLAGNHNLRGNYSPEYAEVFPIGYPYAGYCTCSINQ